MPSLIPKNQNDDEQLKLLAAASTFYGRAKLVAGLQFFLLVPLALVASLVIFLKPEWKVWATCYSLTVALLDVLALDRIQTHYRKFGAKAQELFDTTLFQLDWKFIRAGSKPDGEDIRRAAATFYKNNSDGFIRDWYPITVGELPLPLARLICQRAVCKWDTDLRKSFSIGALVSLALVTLGVLLISIAGEMKAGDMILKVYAPVAPAALWCIREFIRQREAIANLEKLKAHVEQIWESAIQGKLEKQPLEVATREIQDCILDGRSRHPLIFNWVYKLAKPFQEDSMKATAGQLVKEAKAKMKTSLE